MVGRPCFRIDSHGDRAAPFTVLRKGGDQRPHELAPALFRQEPLERRHGGLVAVADRQIEPCKQHFIVAGIVQAKLAVQIVEASGRQLARDAIDEAQLFGRSPASEFGRCGASGGEGGNRLVDIGERRGIGARDIGWKSGLVDPLVKHQLSFQCLVALHQIIAEIRQELGRSHRLERVAIEIGFEPRIEAIATDQLFQRAEEDRALVVDNTARTTVRPGFARLEVKPRRRRSFSLFLQRLRHFVEAEGCLLSGTFGAVYRLHDSIFEIGGEAFV